MTHVILCDTHAWLPITESDLGYWKLILSLRVHEEEIVFNSQVGIVGISTLGGRCKFDIIDWAKVCGRCANDVLLLSSRITSDVTVWAFTLPVRSLSIKEVLAFPFSTEMEASKVAQWLRRESRDISAARLGLIVGTESNVDLVLPFLLDFVPERASDANAVAPYVSTRPLLLSEITKAKVSAWLIGDLDAKDWKLLPVRHYVLLTVCGHIETVVEIDADCQE
jgi:hypothetical protein